MSTMTIPANTLEAGDTVRIEAERHLTVDFERFMGTERLEQIKTAIERARARHEKRLRKHLLSGRYGKRRRQRAQGVARMRHMKREYSRRWLAMVKAATYAR